MTNKLVNGEVYSAIVILENYKSAPQVEPLLDLYKKLTVKLVTLLNPGRKQRTSEFSKVLQQVNKNPYKVLSMW